MRVGIGKAYAPKPRIFRVRFIGMFVKRAGAWCGIRDITSADTKFSKFLEKLS
jgi:hypothetical protein